MNDKEILIKMIQQGEVILTSLSKKIYEAYFRLSAFDELRSKIDIMFLEHE